MQKEIFLIKGGQHESYNDFKIRILSGLENLISTIKLPSVSVVLTEKPPPVISIIPFRKKKIASVSVFSGLEDHKKELIKWEGYAGNYLVEQALPVAYEKTWGDGEKTPGACLLTLFRKKDGLDYNEFLHRWHNGHTPLSLEIHPLWHYNRNVVKNTTVTDNNNHWDGIVEEHTRTVSELLNPFRFFGKPSRVLYNMYRVYADTRSFLDYKTIETYLCAEYHLKSKT